MRIETYVTLLLVLSGGVIMLFAILGTRKIFRLVAKTKYQKNWRLLVYLMLFFFIGYLGTAFFVWQGFENILSLLTGIVFFLGATFVFIVVQTGLYTINDLNEKSNEALEKAQALKMSQKKLHLNNLKLHDQNQQLEQFNYIVSHDLQEPLRTISSVITLMEKEFDQKLGENGDEYLSFISQASGRMQHLIKSLLDYSRLGKVDRKPEIVDLNELINKVLDNLQSSIHETNTIIKIDPLPVVIGHPVEIMQLFQNILSNAIKFRNKEDQPEIYIGVNEIENSWEFAIKDNGIGIPDDHLEEVFVIFQQLHRKGEFEGSGIGLSYCKKIVDLHHGKIWATSEVGKGSTFYFTLPSVTSSFSHSYLKP